MKIKIEINCDTDAFVPEEHFYLEVNRILKELALSFFNESPKSIIKDYNGNTVGYVLIEE